MTRRIILIPFSILLFVIPRKLVSSLVLNFSFIRVPI